jgi:predicted nucleic-acid-binding Zn-ribbon protein
MIQGHEFKCPKCGCETHEYLHDADCGDWCEEVYECAGCGKREYVELAD